MESPPDEIVKNTKSWEEIGAEFRLVLMIFCTGSAMKSKERNNALKRNTEKNPQSERTELPIRILLTEFSFFLLQFFAAQCAGIQRQRCSMKIPALKDPCCSPAPQAP